MHIKFKQFAPDYRNNTHQYQSSNTDLTTQRMNTALCMRFPNEQVVSIFFRK